LSFHERPWAARYEVLGDPAESVYDAVLPLGKSDRYGLRRPDIDIRKLRPFIRYTPDRLTQAGPVVEVVGLGRDDILKFKQDKLDALAEWNRHEAVYIFAWHSKRKEWALIPYPPFRSLCLRIAKRDGMGEFDGSKPYYGVPWLELVRAMGVQRGTYEGAEGGV
jgi:hypothetical protein